jgi:hypothetical protein
MRRIEEREGAAGPYPRRRAARRGAIASLVASTRERKGREKRR